MLQQCSCLFTISQSSFSFSCKADDGKCHDTFITARRAMFWYVCNLALLLIYIMSPYAKCGSMSNLFRSWANDWLINERMYHSTSFLALIFEQILFICVVKVRCGSSQIPKYLYSFVWSTKVSPCGCLISSGTSLKGHLLELKSMHFVFAWFIVNLLLQNQESTRDKYVSNLYLMSVMSLSLTKKAVSSAYKKVDQNFATAGRSFM